MTRTDRSFLIELARRTDDICANHGYVTDAATRVDLTSMITSSLEKTVLITPDAWDEIEQQALVRCLIKYPLARIHVTAESTLAAMQRLAITEAMSDVAALNFASARSPGGGYRNGAVAQEETLARSSGLVPTLERCRTYYNQNRNQDSLLYTDHAIWSPHVPFFTTDQGDLLPKPYVASVITMPAPNTGSMHSEADLLRVIPTFRQRIRWILALAVAKGIQHLVLGAWGCGVFGNHPDLVARLFREALAPTEPWRRALVTVTFAIFDTSTQRASLGAFNNALVDLTTEEQP